MHIIARAVTLALLCATSSQLSAQGSGPAEQKGNPAPMVGDVAPDFSAPMADSSGAMRSPAVLHALEGHVVVVAFYPKDRTGGCTAEMSKFRDDFATIFGRGVTVLPISLDDVASHASWAHDLHLPFALVSDKGGTIAAAYGSLTPGKSYANRTVFVIGKDGKVAYRELRFNPVDQNAYDALRIAIAQANQR